MKVIKAREEANSFELKYVMNKGVGVPEVVKRLGQAAEKGKADDFVNKIVKSNLPNKGILSTVDTKDLGKQLGIEALYGKNSPYMAAPEIKEVPKAPENEKKAPQAEEQKEVTKMDKKTFQERISTFSGPVA